MVYLFVESCPMHYWLSTNIAEIKFFHMGEISKIIVKKPSLFSKKSL